MKNSILIIRLDKELNGQLNVLAKQSGRSRSELARLALRKQLAILLFDTTQRQIMPFAEARGYLTEEDVFNDVS